MNEYLMSCFVVVVFFVCLYGGGVLFIRGIARVLFDLVVMVVTKDIDKEGKTTSLDLIKGRKAKVEKR